MSTSIESILRLPRFSVGDRHIVLTQMRERITAEVADRNAPLLARLQAALADNDRAAQTRVAYDHGSAQSKGRYSAAVHQFDSQVDEQLDLLDLLLNASSHLHAVGQPIGDAARSLRLAIFPAGVGHITRSKISEQHAKVRVLVDRLFSDLASTYEGAGLPNDLRERLRSLSADLDLALRATPTAAPDYESVREHDASAHRSLLRVVAQVLASFGSDAPDNEAVGQSLLDPMLQMAERYRIARRRPNEPADAGTGA